jgi:hypothetical protein
VDDDDLGWRRSAMQLEGGCYCGALRYRVEGDPVFKLQCHCRECQYISGGSVNLTMAMPEAGFRYTQGSPRRFERRDLDDPVTREFCEVCGTHILSRAPGLPVALIKVGTLDDPSAFEGPQMAIYLCDKQPFHQVPAGVATFDRRPG